MKLVRYYKDYNMFFVPDI